MKELNRKVFITIFSILSLIIVGILIIYNVDSYKKEYDGIYRNLTMMKDRDKFVPDKDNINPFFLPNDRDLDDMMIMDYEVYTVVLKDDSIEKIISHSNQKSNFDVEKIAKKIIKEKKKIKIGNLYSSKYSYYYNVNTITIINTKTINYRLVLILLKSIILLLIFELLVYIFSKRLTKRIIKPAEESFEKQKNFIADASHELKTPLAVIMASSDELKEDKKNKKYIDNIKYETDRMNTLIKGLLDLSKLESENLKDNYQEENISKIIERTSLTFEGVAFENSITIDTDIEKELVLKCSKDDIEKLISIILDNAIKHSYKDTNILMKANKEKNNIVIEITNKGDPIKEGDEEKIFERFYRADKSRKRDSNRYGLGLAIAKNIVTNHNGTIKAYSKEGFTTFKINLKK